MLDDDAEQNRVMTQSNSIFLLNFRTAKIGFLSFEGDGSEQLSKIVQKNGTNNHFRQKNT
tara:strand:+ start:8150 stop:8329 length:180 start_codon:yes stop_codon:yes gene_type:complete